MKSNTFIQLYDTDKRAILGAEGTLNYDRRSKRLPNIIKQLRQAKKLPKTAKYAALHKMVLNTIVKLTGLEEIK